MSVKNQVKKNKGFTIIELVVVMAIMGIVGGIIVSMISLGSNQYIGISAKLDGLNEARAAMSFITGEIRRNDESGNVTYNALEEKLTIVREYPILDEFSVPIEDSSGDPITVDDTISIFQDGNEVAYSIGSGSTIPFTMGEVISNLTFNVQTSPDADTENVRIVKKIKVTIEYFTDRSKANMETLTTEITLRSSN